MRERERRTQKEKMTMIAQDNDEQGTTSAHSTVISNAFFKPQTQLDVVQNTSYPQKSTSLDAGQSLALQSACCLWCRNDPMILHRLVAQRSGHTKSGIVLNAVACTATNKRLQKLHGVQVGETCRLWDRARLHMLWCPCP